MQYGTGFQQQGRTFLEWMMKLNEKQVILLSNLFDLWFLIFGLPALRKGPIESVPSVRPFVRPSVCYSETASWIFLIFWMKI